MSLVLGAAFAIFFHPIYAHIWRGMERHDGFAAFLTILIAAIVIVVPLIFFGYALFSEAGRALRASCRRRDRAARKSDQARDWGASPIVLHPSSGTFTLFNLNFSQYITQAVGTVVSNAGRILSSIGGRRVDVFPRVFRVLLSFERWREIAEARRARRSALRANARKRSLTRLVDMATSVVRGSLLMAIAWGVIVGIEFFAFGVPNPVLWGALAIPVAFIPVIGVSLVIIPGILYVALVAGIVKAIIFAIIAFIISALMENILHPRVIGHGKHIHPFLLLLSVLGGISFFGPIGLFLGPLVLELFAHAFRNLSGAHCG